MSDTMMIPIKVNGRVQYVRVSADSEAREHARLQEERERVDGVKKRRMYFTGTQFEEDNQKAAEMYCAGDRRDQRFPEHKRLHAYSTQIEDCVRFVSNRISSGLVVEALDPVVQEVLDRTTELSPQLWTYDEEGERVFTTLEALRDALVAGDIAAHVQWDPVEGAAYVELWESEHVQIVQDTMRGPDKVVLSQDEWRDLDDGTSRVERKTWTWDYEYGPSGRPEVRLVVQWEQDEEPESVSWVGIGRIPWMLLRGSTTGIRAVRGTSLISEQAMETADRYNAVEQVGYLIARYNSHANVAVIGDAALMKIESEGKVNKDVADVLTFPGGTALQVLSLPTDPQMIEHQRNVLSEALHNKFGVTRLDAESLDGLGSISGYALEILNQKSQATFSAITAQWRRDLAGLFDLVLDVQAWMGEGQALVVQDDGVVRPIGEDEEDWTLAEDEFVHNEWWEVDPAEVYPNRQIKITLGSGYIVDDVRIRDDFVQGMISRKEALRKRAYSDTAIDDIEKEIAEEQEKAQAAMLGPMGGEGGFRSGGA